ncbi:hypothetical protein FBU30_000271, partial [Linnemannia zychae]
MRTVDLDPDDDETDSTFTVADDVAADGDDEVMVTTVTEEEVPCDEEFEVVVALAVMLL